MSAPDPATVPRYLPDLPLPAYCHLPGSTPHPLRHPYGHSYGQAVAPDGPPLTATNWADNRLYLRATDLYNHGYWWEAHEWWEALWRQPGTSAESRLLLQALIQLAVALVKRRQRSDRGFRLLLDHAHGKLSRLQQSGLDDYAGVCLGQLLDPMRSLAAAQPGDDPSTAAGTLPAPVIVLRV